MAIMEPISHEKRLTIQAEAAARVVRAFRDALGEHWSEAETPDHIAESFASLLIEGRFCGRLFETTERQLVETTCKEATRAEIRSDPNRAFRRGHPFTCCAFSIDNTEDTTCPVTGVRVL